MSGSAKTILPLDRADVRNSLLQLFSNSEQNIRALFQSLQQKKTLFSTAEVARTLQVDIDLASAIRGAFLSLIDSAHTSNRDEITNELLLSVGADPGKVGLFLDLVGKLSAESRTHAHFLVLAGIYCQHLNSLKGLSTEYNYTTMELVAKGGPTLLFPKTHLIISAKSRTGKSSELELDFDADSFEVFVISLQESLAQMRDEYKVLKRTFGDNFTSLIGE